MLRKGGAALLTTHILDCMGSFHAGDRVYVVVRGDDGGQGVFANGIVRCDESVLRYARDRSIDPRNSPTSIDEPVVVIAAEDLELLWHPRPKTSG